MIASARARLRVIWGLFSSSDIPLTTTAAQGSWTIEAYVDPTLPPIGRAAIGVQDFVSQQLKVSLTGPDRPLAVRRI